MRLLIIGGHFSPALEVIHGLPKNNQILYVGRKYALEGDNSFSLEYRQLEEEKIPFVSITTGRFQRKWTKYTLLSLLKLPIGFFQAFQIIKAFSPTVIMGFGGYVQIPLCIIGYLLRIPIVTHEQTFEAGLANRIIAPIATKICISWKTSSKFFPKNKTVLTGNPAASSVFPHSKQEPTLAFHATPPPSSSWKSKLAQHKKLPFLVIVGGSLGSHAINMLIYDCLEELTKDYVLLHQTGDAQQFRDFSMLEKKRETLPTFYRDNYNLVKFLNPDEIIEAFQLADLVISRAGVNTVTSLLLLEKPSLLIPLPVSQQNEQLKNALLLKKAGLGEVLDQIDILPASFLSRIHDMIEKKSRYKNNMVKAELEIHAQAVKKIIEILAYVEKNSSQKKN